MKRAIAASLAFAAAALLTACGRANVASHQTQTRTSLIVLYQKRNQPECRVRRVDTVRGYRGDRIEWEVVNTCDDRHAFEIRFTNLPGATHDLSASLQPDASRKLFVVVDQSPGEYKYSLYLDGTLNEDPKLEIDPFDH